MVMARMATVRMPTAGVAMAGMATVRMPTAGVVMARMAMARMHMDGTATARKALRTGMPMRCARHGRTVPGRKRTKRRTGAKRDEKNQKPALS